MVWYNQDQYGITAFSGVIDCDYAGTIKIIIFNYGKTIYICMKNKVVEAKRQLALMIATNYLSDIDILYVDEVFPGIKNDYEFM